jgi:DNA polymerase V
MDVQYLYCVFIRYSREGVMMPRRSDIEIAWYASIQQDPNGRKTVTTQRFVQELSNVNWNWTMKQANEWIEWYVTTFRDVSTQEGENRTFQLFNPNGGL